MAYVLKKVQQRLPNGIVRTHYMRLAGFGDGPVTSPDQDPTTGEIQMPDDYVGKGSGPGSPAGGGFDSSSSDVVATVGPIITGAVTSTVDWLKNALTGGSSVQTPPTPGTPITTTITGTGTSGPNLLVLAALGVGGYVAYKHFAKKKGTAR